MKRLLCIALLLGLFDASAIAETAPRKRAVLIGIDDYSASAIPGSGRQQHRGWPDLKGAANDAAILRDTLIHVYGFRPEDIVLLTNQQATRTAILRAIERHLVRLAARGDIHFYYFAGHGSQVPNPASDEADRLDESVVPADSRRGAPDIRDKELRPLFNRILDRGAHLTLLLDHCHSGSGFRGLPNGAHPRGIRPAPAVVDSKSYGPRPEERGALVFASTQDQDPAWEIRGDDGRMHGAFTWAWLRAIRDAAASEPAEETFLRAQARLRTERPDQAPAMLGPAAARLRPFLAARRDRRGGRTVIAVERVDPDGTVVLQGGSASGLSVGTELRVTTSRLRITRILGPGRSAARVESVRATADAIRSGALAEVTAWAAPPGRPLRIWTPRITTPALAPLARNLLAASRGRWLHDPFRSVPTHVLRPGDGGWELLARDGSSRVLRGDASAVAAIARLGPDASLFVQFPAPDTLLHRIGAGLGVVQVHDPIDADYILAGRHTGARVQYAWVRPLVRSEDGDRSDLPLQSAWTDSASTLREALLTLRRIHAWHLLQSPPDTTPPYRLVLRHEETGKVVRDGVVIGDENYSVVLQARHALPAQATPRYYYVFVVDSHGRSYLVFPRSGSVENRFPLRRSAPATIPLGGRHAFRITRPYGIDTYFLLSTDEPLPNPSILEWDGVRAPAWTQPLTPLEQLLRLTITGARSTRTLTTSQWSIERVAFESEEPRRRRW